MMSNRYTEGMVWNDIKIGNDVYIVSLARRDDAIDIFLTNLIEIWMETLTDEIILHRCRTLNPLLNVDALNYSEIVANILSNLSEHIIEASVEEIKLRAQVQGGSMKFALNLSKGTPQNFWEIITKPLCISSMEITREHKILLDLIKKKDEEIAEYKAEGAELIRKNIATNTFKEEELKRNILVPNIVDCTSAFQAMMNFYNELNLYDSQISTKSGSSISKSGEAGKMGQNIITPSEDDNTCGSNEVTSNGLIHRKPETSPSTSKGLNRSTTNEQRTGNKTRVINLVHKPIKKLKKGINDFI